MSQTSVVVLMGLAGAVWLLISIGFILWERRRYERTLIELRDEALRLTKQLVNLTNVTNIFVENMIEATSGSADEAKLNTQVYEQLKEWNDLVDTCPTVGSEGET